MEPILLHSFYRALLATVLSNIGSSMQNAAAGWLMTSLRPDPFEVALVQAATTLPMFASPPYWSRRMAPPLLTGKSLTLHPLNEG